MIKVYIKLGFSSVTVSLVLCVFIARHKMRKHKDDNILNDEELDFLSVVMQIIEDDTEISKLPSFNITGPEIEFFKKLGFADQLQLAAQFGLFRFIFPLEISHDKLGAVSLSFLAPEIYENGDAKRLWRSSPDQNIALLSQDGNKLDFSVKDISSSGIALEVDKSKVAIPFDLKNIYLQLPDNTLIPLQGNLIRFINSTSAAFELDEDLESSEALKFYLFKMHQDRFVDQKKDKR